jgi:branched-chain amino acid transport system substrate-binding protein
VQTFRAIAAAVGQINKTGGVLNHRPLKVISGTDGGQATDAPTVVQSLLDQGAVAIIMASASPSFLQVKAIVQKAQVPTISPINTNPGSPQPPNAD